MNDPRNMFVNQRANTAQVGGNQPKTNKHTAPNGNTNQSNNTNSHNQQQASNSKQDKNDTTSNDGKNYNNMSIDERKAMLTELASKYQKEGEAQLIKDILSNVIDQKAKGQLSNDQLREFSRRVMPLLNGEQRTRLSALLEQLLQL